MLQQAVEYENNGRRRRFRPVAKEWGHRAEGLMSSLDLSRDGDSRIDSLSHALSRIERHGSRLYYKKNIFQQLRGFCRVAATGSFTEAAEDLFLSQSAVSLQIQALERDFRVRLIERRRGEVSLTHEGRLLYEMAAPLVSRLEKLPRQFDERLRDVESGEVVCAICEGMMMHVMPSFLAKFNAQFPRIDVVCRAIPLLNIPGAVSRSDVDLGIGLAYPITSNDLTYHPLVSFSHFLVVPRDHALATRNKVRLDEIVDYPLVAPTEDAAVWRGVRELLRKRGLHWQVVAHIDHDMARLRCVASGMGITFTAGPPWAHSLASNLVWIPIDEDLPELIYGLIVRKDEWVSIAARRLTEFLLKCDWAGPIGAI